MTNNEIDLALARALGWPDEAISDFFGSVFCYGRCFDHLDWHITGPVAAKYKLFPFGLRDGSWSSDDYWTESPVPQTAIALAVIRRAGK